MDLAAHLACAATCLLGDVVEWPRASLAMRRATHTLLHQPTARMKAVNLLFLLPGTQWKPTASIHVLHAQENYNIGTEGARALGALLAASTSIKVGVRRPL